MGMRHYGEVRFNVIIPKFIAMMDAAALPQQEYSDEIVVYGQAIRAFGKWE